MAPFVGILLAPIPLMLLVIRWGLRTAVLAAIVAGLILLQFFGPVNAVSMGGIFAPLGLALGWGVRRRIGAPLTVLAGFITSIIVPFNFSSQSSDLGVLRDIVTVRVVQYVANYAGLACGLLVFSLAAGTRPPRRRAGTRTG